MIELPTVKLTDQHTENAVFRRKHVLEKNGLLPGFSVRFSCSSKTPHGAQCGTRVTPRPTSLNKWYLLWNGYHPSVHSSEAKGRNTKYPWLNTCYSVLCGLTSIRKLKPAGGKKPI